MTNKKAVIDFFKPDYAKAIIFLLLFLFLPVVLPCFNNHCLFVLPLAVGFCDNESNCVPLISSPGTVFGALMIELGKEPSFWYNPNMWYPWYMEYVIYHIFVAYMLSCIVIFGYNKFRSKK